MGDTAKDLYTSTGSIKRDFISLMKGFGILKRKKEKGRSKKGKEKELENRKKKKRKEREEGFFKVVIQRCLFL